MKFRKIVGFGDSWMFGDELRDPALSQCNMQDPTFWYENFDYRTKHCFLGQLGHHYGVEVENFGLPGGSLQSEIWCLLWWLQHEPDPHNCLVLVAHTDGDRMSWYRDDYINLKHGPWNRFVHTGCIDANDDEIPAEWKDLSKRFIAMAAGPGFHKMNWLQTVTLFDGVAARHHIPMLQFQVAPINRTVNLPTMILPDLDLITWFFQKPENSEGRRELWCPNGHPNEKGHELIRDLLIQEIDHAIL